MVEPSTDKFDHLDPEVVALMEARAEKQGQLVREGLGRDPNFSYRQMRQVARDHDPTSILEEDEDDIDPSWNFFYADLLDKVLWSPVNTKIISYGSFSTNYPSANNSRPGWLNAVRRPSFLNSTFDPDPLPPLSWLPTWIDPAPSLPDWARLEPGDVFKALGGKLP